jgi:predicted DNA-binding transcriptional regulator AlpA
MPHKVKQADSAHSSHEMAYGHKASCQAQRSAKRIQAAHVREICGGISDMTLWRWLNERDFPRPIYIARRRYWREADVTDWLEARAGAPE